jgi:hypothetical protein
MNTLQNELLRPMLQPRHNRYLEVSDLNIS